MKRLSKAVRDATGKSPHMAEKKLRGKTNFPRSHSARVNQDSRGSSEHLFVFCMLLHFRLY